MSQPNSLSTETGIYSTAAIREPIKLSPPWLKQLVKDLRVKWMVAADNSRYPVPILPVALSTEQRNQAEARLQLLQSALQPSPIDDIQRGSTLADLFVVLSRERMDEETENRRARVYLDDIAECLPATIALAALWWRRGNHLEDGENRKFIPKPVELIRLATMAKEHIEAETLLVKRLLAAKADPAGIADLQSYDRMSAET